MLETEKEVWIDIIDSYKEMSFLWDTKDKNYLNRKMRTEAYDILLEKYLKVESKGTVGILKKRLENMRAAYFRERRKVQQSIEKGLESPHVPSLWYYKHLLFLDALPVQTKSRSNTVNGEEYSFNFNRYKNKIYLERQRNKSLKRLREEANSREEPVERRRRVYTEIEPQQSSEEESLPQTPRPQPKRRIFEILKKQERFLETASKLLSKKEKDWEIIGKAIGLQLSELKGKQQSIAQKLISDAIFYGSMGKLNMEAFISIQNYEPGSPESNVTKEMPNSVEVYLEDESPTYEEFRDKLEDN